MDLQTIDPELPRARYIGSLLSMKAPFAMAETLLSVLLIVLGWFSVTLEVFIRHSFGERYLSLLKIWLAYATMGTFSFLFTLALVLAGANPLMFFAYSAQIRTLFAYGLGGMFYHLFVWSWLALAAFHLWSIHRRNRAAIPWHSMSFGVSHLERIPWHRLQAIPYVGKYVKIGDYTLYRFIEPGLFFVLGYLLLRPIDPLLGWWMTIASVALFLKNNLAYIALRSRFLSLMDANIEAHNLSSAMNGTPKQETAGFSVIPVPMQAMWDDEALDLSASVQETLGID